MNPTNDLYPYTCILSAHEFDCIMDALEQIEKLIYSARGMERIHYSLHCLQKALCRFSYFDAENRMVMMYLMDWEQKLLLEISDYYAPPMDFQKSFFTSCINRTDCRTWSAMS